MHLHEAKQHLLYAVGAGALSEDDYLRLSDGLEELGDVLERLPWVDKSELLAFYPYKPVVAHEQ